MRTTPAGTWCRFRDAFDAALAQATELGDDDRAQVAGAFFQLAPHPDVEPARLALVASHGWDVHGALRAGLTAAWFPRSERTYPAVYDPAALVAEDLGGAVDALLALPPA